MANLRIDAGSCLFCLGGYLFCLCTGSPLWALPLHILVVVEVCYFAACLLQLVPPGTHIPTHIHPHTQLVYFPLNQTYTHTHTPTYTASIFSP